MNAAHECGWAKGFTAAVEAPVEIEAEALGAKPSGWTYSRSKRAGTHTTTPPPGPLRSPGRGVGAGESGNSWPRARSNPVVRFRHVPCITSLQETRANGNVRPGA